MITLKNFARKLFAEQIKKGTTTSREFNSVAAELGISTQKILQSASAVKRCGGNQFSTIQGVKFHQEDSDEVQSLKRQLADLKEDNAF